MSATIQEPTLIPLGQRIGEILEERGSAFSIRAFSARIGMSKDMLSRMISGDRYISPSELEQIANGLSLTVARLKQQDTAQLLEEMQKLVDSEDKTDKALSIGLKIKNIAIGCTERFIVGNLLGNAYYVLNRFDEAHFEWLEANEHAKKIADRYKETNSLYRVMTNLVLSFTARKDYVGLNTLVGQLKPLFEPFPRRLGVLYYSTATTAFHTGNLKEARSLFIQALEQFELTGHATDIGLAQHNVGFLEYMLGNLEQSKQYYEKALETFPTMEIQRRLVSIKDYVKTLLKLGEVDKANEMIREAFEVLETIDLPSRRAQFMILHAIVNEDISTAAQVVMMEGTTNDLKRIACKFLMEYYCRIGDSENLMRYYVIAGSYGTNDSTIIIDEEGL
jgi:tetratricopeptide (TPR) repeat protein